MPWERPTLKQLCDRIGADFSGRLLDGAPVRPQSVVGVFSKIWAGACHMMHGMLAWLFLQVFADTAEGPYLERWSRIWGIFRKVAARAAGHVLLRGVEGTVIPAGLLLQHAGTGVQYALAADATVTNGVAIMPVVAVVEGIAGNLPPGAPLTLVAPFAGVLAQGEVAASGITGGADAETDDALRARFIARLRKPPRGGSVNDYVTWALEVPGVTRAWCYPMGLGIGTVSLCFCTDDAPEGPVPSPEMVRRVQAHIEPLRPATVKVWQAFAPEVLPIKIRVTLLPDTEANRAAVREELADLFLREGEPGTILLRSHITEAISLAPGEFDHILHTPVENIVVPEGYLPLLLNPAEDVEFVGATW